MKKLSWPGHRLDRLFDCYAYLNNDLKTKAYAAWVNPSDFLAATTPIGSRDRIEAEARPLNRPSLDAEDQEIFLRGRIDLARRMLVLDGHEGRHHGQLTRLDPEVEAEHRQPHRGSRCAEIADRRDEPEAVHQPQREGE